MSGKSSKRRRREEVQSRREQSVTGNAIQFSTFERWLLWLGIIFCVCFVVALRAQTYWTAYFSSAPDRSWDGSGHVALLEIYDRTIFPDTFGWTDAFFGGMPFPNFYPPLWYWSIAALHHLGSPLALTYKMVVLGSMLLIPLLLARLSFVLSGSLYASTTTAVLSLVPMLASGMMPRYAAGLTFASTFNEGIYTEPLGFVFLLLTITSLLQLHSHASSIQTGMLLSSTLLANLFTLVSALPFLLAVCVYPASERLAQFLRACVVCATTTLLTAFWVVPVLTHYKYFVTVPVRPPLQEVISTGLWFWLAAGLGSAVWSFIQSGQGMKVYVLGLLGLLLACICAYAPGLEWLPLQLPRLVAILELLLTVPLADAAYRASRYLFHTAGIKLTTTRMAWGVPLAISTLFAVLLPLCDFDLSLRSKENTADMDAVLAFAKAHQDGRYMVQTPHRYHNRYEARAITSYLGAQGNQTATVVFRESALSSLFYVPMDNKVSSLRRAFGISSSLDNDLKFLNEPPDIANAQLRELGIRYLVRREEEQMRSASGKTVLSAGPWEIVQLGSTKMPNTDVLTVLPALLFSDISYKRRRSGQIDANRIFEEQFRVADFGVRLALSPAQTIDALDHIDSFGALILNKFDVHDEEAASSLIEKFSQTKPVIVLPDASEFCRRLLDHKDQMPGMVELEVERTDKQAWLGEGDQTSDAHENQIKRTWERIARILTASKLPTEASSIGSSADQSPLEAPLLMHRTFDASWRTDDRSPIYLSAPATTFLLSGKALPLSFRRNELERVACMISAFGGFLIGLCLWVLRFIRRASARAL